MRVDEMSSSELFTEMTDRQRDEIFRMVWFGNVEDDVRTYINEFYEDAFSEEDIEEIEECVANDIVYHGRLDSYISYWDNLEKLIEKHR